MTLSPKDAIFLIRVEKGSTYILTKKPSTTIHVFLGQFYAHQSIDERAV